MKLSVLSEHLQKKLPLLNHAISSKSPLAILLNILLEAKEGKLRISTTDLEIGIQTELPAQIEVEGSITVPAKLFTDLLTSLPEEKIVLEEKDGKLEIVSSHTKSTLQTTSPDEFPKLFEEKGEEIALLQQKDIQQCFSQVVFAASIDATRPALSGLLIKKEKLQQGEGFLFVATDGYRLSLKHYALESGKSTEDFQFLIPARIIKEVCLLKTEGEGIGVYVSKKFNQVLFVHGDTVLVGRLIEAEFPAYEKIIPQDFETQVTFDKDEMQKAVKICSIFARDSANIIRFELTKDKIVVSANSPSVGENSVEVEAKTSGEDNKIAFNARFLFDLFANIEEKDLVFEMSGPLSPGVFKIQNDPTFLHLIMPVRIQTEE